MRIELVLKLAGNLGIEIVDPGIKPVERKTVPGKNKCLDDISRGCAGLVTQSDDKGRSAAIDCVISEKG